MPAPQQRYQVISVSLPKHLVERANALIPKTRRSRVIGEVLTSFLEAVERKKLEQGYRAYYASRSTREAQTERTLLADWAPSDAEMWAILEKEETGARRRPR